ncbi:UdgX family uracil-DNA binding protein [Marivita sp. S0852]|uniref:UdgX family uracil-DNA binding protein n=1 Tax=Marivita sp. S0852 TaxID=3373893 RepID=UPI003982B424
MQRIVLPRIGTDTAWRDAARGCLAAGVRPEDVTFTDPDSAGGLFDSAAAPPAASLAELRVPKSFVALARSVVWHSAPARFDLLYLALHRLQQERGLMSDRADPLIQKLRGMEKNVHRCQHKMKAFVRFREIGQPDAPRRSFAAWFEPTHFTVEPTADFFAKRFADMDWRIVTPDISAIFEDGTLRFVTDLPKPDLGEDAHEELWKTYFCNIFNPARLKVRAMTSEMPRKYWKNMPEAAMIPKLIAEAPARAKAMAEAAPTLPAPRARAVQAAAHWGTAWTGPEDAFAQALAGCTRCPLHASATQAVAGQGPRDADLMIVGEQPGDREDLQNAPFVGPAGTLLRNAMTEAGVDPGGVYLTNAVKHFKHKVRGKRRLHQTPNVSEIQHCRFWLNAEIAQIEPKVIVALGASAALALTGDKADITARRGRLETGLHGGSVLITVHPAHVLRTPDAARKADLHQMLVRDLAQAQAVSRKAREDQGGIWVL